MGSPPQPIIFLQASTMPLYFIFCIIIVFTINFVSSWGVETCALDPLKNTPFCDTSLPTNERVADLLNRLTNDEKIGMLGNNASGVERFNINHYEWHQEALHGLGFSPGANFSGYAKYVTSYPQVCNLGRTFDKDLWGRIGHAISEEARALANLKQGYHSFWAPNVNVLIDPRWGRAQEVTGEDPFQMGVYAVEYVKNMIQGEDPRYLKTIPTCKHYTAYAFDRYKGVDRYHFNAIVSDRVMEETIQPPFRACVKEGQVNQIMCAYNSVNGIPQCADKRLMNGVMREEWGFDGHVVSDCDAVSVIINPHNYTQTVEDTCKVALEGGCDLNCGKFYQNYVGQAVEKGIVSVHDVDVAVGRMLRNRVRVGEFDDWEDQPYRKIPHTVIDSHNHRQLSLEAARKSMVLLKNRNKTLPLDEDVVQSVGLIGPYAKASKEFIGSYRSPAPFIKTIYDELLIWTDEMEIPMWYSKGCDPNSTDKSHFEEAVKVAKESDMVVLAMGMDCEGTIDQRIEGEMHDRVSLRLPGVQEELIKLVTENAAGTVVLVLIGSGGNDISYSKENNDAIIIAGYPNQWAGKAIVEVIMGQDGDGNFLTPSGKLATTMYKEDYVDLCDFRDMTMRPKGKCPGRTYRFLRDYEPLYEFGAGLSFTTFEYVWYEKAAKTEEVSRDFIIGGGNVNLRVNVTNTGKLDADNIVLAFISNMEMDDAPVKELFGFERIHLKAGEMKTVVFSLGRRALEYVDETALRRVVKGEYEVLISGLDLKKRLFLY